MKIVGLTGGIGSGKSETSVLFASLGVPVVDTDLIARQLTAVGGKANSLIGAAFGAKMLGDGGELRRDKMRALAFNDPSARQKLEAILHPLIRQQSQAELAALEQSHPYAILVIPLLFESRAYRGILWRTLNIDCSHAAQVVRVGKRSGLGVAEIEKIIHSQVPRPIRLQLADHVIHNDGDVGLLEPQASRLHRLFLDVSGSAGKPA